MRQFRIILITIILITMITTVYAFPEMMDGFNRKYDTSRTRLDTCGLCHTSGKPQKPACDEACHNGKPVKLKDSNLNPYGIKMKDNLNVDGMDKAFEILENLDSDKDGFSNIIEIHNLTFPGDKKDNPNKKRKIILTNSTSSTNLFDEIVKLIFERI